MFGGRPQGLAAYLPNILHYLKGLYFDSDFGDNLVGFEKKLKKINSLVERVGCACGGELPVGEG